jgi:KUP system potassium uptake protein
MLVTTILTTVVATRHCVQSGRTALLPPLLLMMGGIGTLDALLVAACSLKFLDGAWFSVAAAAALFVFMFTWARGNAMLQATILAEQPPLSPFLAWLGQEPLQRTPRLAIYAVAETEVVPSALTLNLRHYQVSRMDPRDPFAAPVPNVF